MFTPIRVLQKIVLAVALVLTASSGLSAQECVALPFDIDSFGISLESFDDANSMASEMAHNELGETLANLLINGYMICYVDIDFDGPTSSTVVANRFLVDWKLKGVIFYWDPFPPAPPEVPVPVEIDP